MSIDSQGRMTTFQGNCSNYSPNINKPVKGLYDVSKGQIYDCSNLIGSNQCWGCGNRRDMKQFKSPNTICLGKTTFPFKYVISDKPSRYAGLRNIFHGKVVDIESIDDNTIVVGMLDDLINEERCFIIKDSEFQFEFSNFMRTKYDLTKDRIRFFAEREINDDREPWKLIGFMTDLGHEGGRTTFTN